MTDEVRRWSSREDDLDPRYEESAAAFRAAGPSEAQVARMLNAIGGAGAVAAASSPSGRVSFSTAKGVVAGVGLAGVVAVGSWLFSGPPAAQRSRPPPPSEVTAQPPPAAAPHEVTSSAQRETAVPKPVSKRKAQRAPMESTRHDPMEELKLLQRARRVLATNPATSLELSKQHAEAYADGSLSEERDALEIEALVGMGETTTAAQRLRRFRLRYSRSIHLERLQALLLQKPEVSSGSGH